MAMSYQAHWLQKNDRECYRQLPDHDALNSHADTQADKIHSLHGNVRRLLSENEELCNLCCFLDDDRQRYRRDVIEWQKLHQAMAADITKKVT